MPSTMTDLKGKGKESADAPPLAAQAGATTSTQSATMAVTEDDDELDDLDDVLDQFNAGPLETKASTSVTPGTQDAYDRATRQQQQQQLSDKGSKGNSGESNGNDDDDDDDDEDFEAQFAAELAKEMEKMLGGGAAAAASGPTKAGTAGATSKGLQDLDDEEKDILGDDKELQEAFERIMASAKMGTGDGSDLKDEDFNLEELSKLMSSLGAGGFPGLDGLGSGTDNPFKSGQQGTSSSSKSGGNAGSSSTSKGPTTKPQNFNETLQATMSRLADSEAQHKSRSAKTAAQDPNDPLAALMAQMEAMGGLGKDGDDENLPELLDGLMDQLMSKELLQEPISELKDKYPEYLKSGEAASLPLEERQRYEKQESIVLQIHTIFEDPTYDDNDKGTREKVATLMQQMQECGAPPKHLMGELGPAMGLNADGTPNMDPENCIIC